MTAANDDGPVGESNAPTTLSCPVWEVIPEPTLRITTAGDISQEDAAIWCAYRMQRPEFSVRTLERWRTNKTGPVYHKIPKGKQVWYRKADIDDWIAINCCKDPLAA